MVIETDLYSMYGGALANYMLPIIHLTMLRDDVRLSTGTAFALRHRDTSFIVTALHNITGRNHYTGKPLSKTAGIPNRVVLKGAMSGRPAKPTLDGNLSLEEDALFGYYDKQKWGDLLALPMLGLQWAEGSCLNDNRQKNWSVYPGVDVFCAGYPGGISTSGAPILKKGSLASMPGFRVQEEDCFLIDMPTYYGLSGGPIMIVKDGGLADDGDGVFNKVHIVGGGIRHRVIGVYGGRYLDDTGSGTLGYGWPLFRQARSFLEDAYEYIAEKVGDGSIKQA